jgi:AraC-like DNA-binding protein
MSRSDCSQVHEAGTVCVHCAREAQWLEITDASISGLAVALREAEREVFEEALMQFAARLACPIGAAAERWLRERLRTVCDRASVALHGNQHKSARRSCEFPPPYLFHAAWDRTRVPAPTQLRRWLAAFLRVFDTRHDVGAPVRTAKLLRRAARTALTMEDVAHRMGMSSAVLERRFEARYGLTPKAFHTRVRVRAAVLELHGSDVKVEYVARRVGYAGVANFYTALGRCTGLTPSEVRELERDALKAILDDQLEIRAARLFESQQGQRLGD